MAIIKTKDIYNTKNIHYIYHGYRTTSPEFWTAVRKIKGLV
jgi:hypothetical protein